ncbi:MAG: SIMPL domain-containing protein [Pseudomonadota bacterium]
MTSHTRSSALILAIGVAIGLIGLGAFLHSAALDYKATERTVRVKGLSEREYPADIVIWPIQFTVADNDLGLLYETINRNSSAIRQFLNTRGIDNAEITTPAPAIVDKSAQQYGGGPRAQFRFSAIQTVTVYSDDIDTVRNAMNGLSALGEQGIVLSGDNYMAQTEYLFTRLNDVKPDMIEEATRKAREVAEKFASDSDSRLGKIRKASQGQFSISPRDKNNPHIKRVRVVSTVEYYLSD